MGQKPKEKDGIEYKTLPAVSDLEDSVRRDIIQLLELLDSTTAKIAGLEAVEEDCKQRLEDLQQKCARPGFRFGFLCFASVPVPGRKTLDKMLLMENGVPAKVINDSYKTGEPGTRRTFKRLGEDDD